MNDSQDRLSNEVVREQAETIKQLFISYRDNLVSKAGRIEYIEKADTSPVTVLDLEIEESLSELFADKYPSVPIYGEETELYDSRQSLFWLIDPIDGTRSFIEGVPTFTNMAALIENGEIRASIIYNPSRDDLYEAYAGQGAYRNGLRINLGLHTDESTVLVKNKFFSDMEAIFSGANFRYVDPPSGGGNGFTQLVDGAVIMRFQLHASGSAHDYAPGALLVREAGGVILPIGDPQYTYESSSFVACHPAFANIVEQHLAEIRALGR